MSSRSLKVAPHHISTVRNALTRNGFPSQQALATEIGFSRDTVRKFLKGEGIDRLNFIECCEKLGLDWQEIADFSQDDDTPDDPSFVGREKAIAALDTRYKKEKAKIILIHASGGIGKTELAQQYLKKQGFELIIELNMATETERITSVGNIIEGWFTDKFKQETGREFGITLERLRQQLKTRRVGILIDNLEPALDQGKFITEHRNYVELLRVLGDASVQSLTLITSRENLAESAISYKYYRLDGLDEAAWTQYFTYQELNIDIPILKQMCDAYAGNAKAMTIICGAIRTDYDGDMVAYWKDYKDDLLARPQLEDLVTTQFNRLKNNHPDAYRLLCRLGCYRYQDVATVPTEGLLCLLWDVEEGKQRRVIERLKDCALVEHKKGEYWLHPVIKQKALGRLKKTEDWEIANRKAADFWTDSVESVNTVEDAIRALEAYYHYVAINDYEKAAHIILTKRNNQWVESAALGKSFYRLSLLNKSITIINSIISKIKKPLKLGALYNILGDSYWLTGNIKRAIYCHHNSSILSVTLQNTNPNQLDINLPIKIIELAAKLNIGLCKIDLWELQEAEKLLQEVSDFCDFYDVKYYQFTQHSLYSVIGAELALVWLKSLLYPKDIAKSWLKRTEKIIDSERIRYTEWSAGNKFIFLGATYKNLNDLEKSFQTYQQALDYAEKSKYTQVKAKALTGLGELYRIQKDHEAALKHHKESIEILEEIGAKCDLAEAYYQLALTHQELGNEDSQQYFNKAIEIFKEIEAPKQIERVQKSMRKRL